MFLTLLYEGMLSAPIKIAWNNNQNICFYRDLRKLWHLLSLLIKISGPPEPWLNNTLKKNESTYISGRLVFIFSQAREREEKERLHKQQQLDDNMTEIANHVFGDVLTENPAVAQSAFGPHRVITDRWKGMSPQQLEDIRKQQDLQRIEKEVGVYSKLIILILIQNSVFTLSYRWTRILELQFPRINPCLPEPGFILHCK